MQAVPLVYALKPHAGEDWQLRRTRRGLALYDSDEQVIVEIPNADVGLRVRFPSFWASVRYLTILDESDRPHCFEPESGTVTRVRELVEECLGADPEAAAQVLRSKARRDLLIGGGSFGLGVVVTVASFLSANPGGKFVITTGLLVVGMIEIARGLYLQGKARRLARRVDRPDE